jgi:DeoR family fructose operon transcriptional repressor
MLIPERQSRLQQIVSAKGVIDLDSLVRELNVSASTVRRDLGELEERGLVRRTHGGVVWTGGDESRDTARPYAFAQRMQFRVDVKRRLARAAKTLVQPGETILLDGGSSTYYLAEALRGTRLQVVTNSLPIAELYADDDQVETILTGGLIYPQYGVLVGPMAEATLATIHTKTLFLSVAGVHRGTLYNQNMLLVTAEQRMMEQSQRTILLIDSSKFGQQALVKLCALDRVDAIVTDAEPPDVMRAEIDRAGCELIVADE